MNMLLFAQAVGGFPLTALDIIIFAGFIIAVIAVSLGVSGKAGQSSEDYFLAGRGLKWWLIGVSLIAANISTEQFVGMSGNAAQCTGLAIASYEWIAAATLVAVAFIFLPMFLKRGIYTIPEFLEYRYNKLSRSLLSLFMMVILVGVSTAAVISMGALTISTLFQGEVIRLFGFKMEITLLNAAWVMGILTAIYVFVGGLKACAWADLLQGTALILGGVVVMFYAFAEFDKFDVNQIKTTPVYARPDAYKGTDTQNMLVNVRQGDKVLDKFQQANADKLHMLRPTTDPNIVWTTLLLGIWIPNLYYWGLNQYIMQRTLASQSLSEGQKGLVFAAFLKLLIPFIVVFPGILAFNMYHNQMADAARDDGMSNAPTLALYDRLTTGETQPGDKANTLFRFDRDYAVLYPDKALAITQYNMRKLSQNPDAVYDRVTDEKDNWLLNPVNAPDKELIPILQKDISLAKALALVRVNATVLKEAAMATVMEKWTGRSAKTEVFEEAKELIGYKYDAAFPLLLKNLPFHNGIRGFVLAALLGLVLSTLAALLNAASTIFTMDLYREYINENASQKSLVFVGRLCVLVFTVTACLLVPILNDPKFGGLFKYIQEFSGYLSPGVLAIFVFGILSKRVPGFAGSTALLLGPCIYGALKIVPVAFLNEMNFLNQMAVTFGILLFLLTVLTLLFPREKPHHLETKTEMDLRSSRGALFGGVVIVLITAALYCYFW